MARNRTDEPEPAAEKNHGGDSSSEGSDTEARSGNSLSSESSGHSSAAAESGGHSSAAEESGGHSSAAEDSGGHSSAAEEESSGHSSAAEEEEEEAEQRDDSDEEQIRQLFEEKMRKKGKKTASNGEASQGKKNGEASQGKKNGEASQGKKRGKMEEKESNVGKKKTKGKEKVAEDESKVKFPMNRIYKIMKDQRCSSKIGQETIFLANKAVEKFLELYCREAYACAFLEHKKQISYDHLASVVSKRERFRFLSDIVPERVKAEDALAEIKEEDK